MSEQLQILASLIKESLAYLKELKNQGFESVYVTDPNTWIADRPPPSLQVVEKKPLPPPPIEPVIAVKNPPPPSPPPKKSEEATPLETKWALIPLPPVDETKTLYHRFASFFPKESLTEPACVAYLLLPEEKPACRLFLENVSKAVTRSLAPACVALAHEKKWDAWFADKGKLIAAPLSLVKKKIPLAQTHCFYPIGASTLLALEELESYLHDLNLKRTLWNTLKTFHFQNSPRSL